ncbi:MAG: HPr(Ser) kinase/phosphatase [Oscillospiraceae bacterium]
MADNYTVSLDKIIAEFKLETIYLPTEAEKIFVGSSEVNRPGLQLSGFYNLFDNRRIEILGNAEVEYALQFPKEELEKRVEEYFSLKPPVVVITRSMEYPQCFIEAAKKHCVALLRTPEATSEFIAALVAMLNVRLAPRITRHGVLVEVYGVGVLLLGESGVGKSETAIELIKRGHRLIADDAVEIRRVSNRTLVGSSPENIRHFMELRGVGIVNARRLFGVGSVNVTERVDMVIQLEIWDNNKPYDRMCLDEEQTEILGIKVPCYTIPVKPGRNLAVIIEVAAMSRREKKMGFNAAKELLDQLGMLSEESRDDTKNISIWS